MKRTVSKVQILLYTLLLAATVVTAAPAGDEGIELYNQKDYKAAAEKLATAVSQHPDDREARYYLALSLIELGRFQEAEGHLKALSPEEQMTKDREAEVHLALGRVKIGQELYAEATKDLDMAVSLAPDNPEIRLRRAEAELQQKKYDLAVKDAEKAIEVEPRTAYAHYYAGIAYSNLKRPDKMAEHFRIFLELAPDAPEAAKIQSLLRSLRR
jgi:tetratricopeptide (TPR) repeat protein